MIYGTNLSRSVTNNTFINTLFGNNANNYCPENGNVRINCYSTNLQVYVKDKSNAFPDFTISQEERLNNGFKGTDGSVVGADGGIASFSMEPEGIHIKESILRVDPETKQLNVTLKVE
jgi:hypothetical protein